MGYTPLPVQSAPLAPRRTAGSGNPRSTNRAAALYRRIAALGDDVPARIAGDGSSQSDPPGLAADLPLSAICRRQAWRSPPATGEPPASRVRDAGARVSSHASDRPGLPAGMFGDYRPR